MKRTCSATMVDYSIPYDNLLVKTDYFSPKKRKQSHCYFGGMEWNFPKLLYPVRNYNDFWLYFPRELFAIILSYLNRNSVCKSLSVCKSWSFQSSNEYLWKLLYERDVKKLSFTSQRWKNLYRNWVLSNGLEIHLVSDKETIKEGETITFTISLMNKRCEDINVVDGHSHYGSDLENGAIFCLKSTDTFNNPFECFPFSSQQINLNGGNFSAGTIPPGGILTYRVCARYRSSYYFFEEYSIPYFHSSIQYALHNPKSTSKHTLQVILQRPKIDSRYLYYQQRGNFTVNNFAKVWDGETTSNTITISTLF